ncbi:hypothetical protein JMUB7547_28770 [Staphylococcus aureus]
MSASLVGSEMCIRDSRHIVHSHLYATLNYIGTVVDICLLYTSDAADEARSVDLGGRRIIKKHN